VTRQLSPLALLLVAACGHVSVPTVLTEKHDVAVATACVKPDQRPTQPTRLHEDLFTPPVSLTEKVGRLRAKLKEWQDIYGPTADGIIKACQQVPKP
jgi:hypothetical protein